MPYTEEEKKQELKKIHEQFAKCSVPAEYEDIDIEEMMLASEDGVRLKTILYRPKSPVPLPVAVVRTCYPDGDFSYRATALEYARRGFGYVIQYCRGVGGSEGKWEPNVNERKDGKALLDWMEAQDWIECIGYGGCSYLALTGWVIADILPPKVKTMYLTHYGVFRHTSAYQDGLFRHDILTSWAMWNAGFPIKADYLESCRFRPQIKVDEELWGRRIDWYRDWITHPDPSDSYWEEGFWGMLRGIPSKVKIPLYVGEGWYDHHLGSAIQSYCSLPDEVKAHSTFSVGAWDHNFNVALEGREGTHFENEDVLRCFYWFYDILVKKNVPAGKIRNYICGADVWHERESYEIEDAGELALYFGGEMEASLGERAYSLTETENPKGGEARYVYDPSNPVMTHGAESLLATSQEQGSLLQEKCGYREDVLSFLSKPLKKDYTVMGKIRACLRISSDAEDTAFAVKVMEVMPDGRAYNIRTGVTTLAYRNGAKKRMEYEPGTKTDIEVEMWDIAWKLHQGSRIRVDIASSDFPQYSIHSNFAGIWAYAEKEKAALQTIYFGRGANSRVIFPVIM